MSQKKLSVLLRATVIMMAFLGAAVYLWILPTIGRDWASIEGAEGLFWPWLLFLWGTAVPCYVALYKFWQICCEIGEDNSFCEENAQRLKEISILAIGDVAYFFAGNVTLILLNMNHPGIFLVSIAIDLVGLAVGIAAAALARLVYKAADIKSENDLTI